MKEEGTMNVVALLYMLAPVGLVTLWVAGLAHSLKRVDR